MPHMPRNHRLALKLAIVGASLIALQGCGGAMANMFGPRAPAVEQIRVPQTGPTRPPAGAGAAAPGIIRSADIAQRRDIALNVTYLERILVPVGSDLVVQAQSGGNRPPAIRRVQTQGGPPYSINLPVDTGQGAYPMTVQATLRSTIGHVLTGATVLQARPSGPVDIVMRTRRADTAE
ncbi:hypothetical protein [Roseovarius dicentrarchi]|uniref:hypothetical protein n=1 Tax=Roseovarius dicentrarchi TaxID=2250573 RepID=UPI000DE894C3|nr:hypothetical protein [Roseovarius dicentrarchi]